VISSATLAINSSLPSVPLHYLLCEWNGKVDLLLEDLLEINLDVIFIEDGFQCPDTQAREVRIRKTDQTHDCRNGRWGCFSNCRCWRRTRSCWRRRSLRSGITWWWAIRGSRRWTRLRLRLASSLCWRSGLCVRHSWRTRCSGTGLELRLGWRCWSSLRFLRHRITAIVCLKLSILCKEEEGDPDRPLLLARENQFVRSSP
jgi:hypothetical protein